MLPVKERISMQLEFGGTDPANIKIFTSWLQSARKFVIDSNTQAQSDRVGIENDLAILNSTKIDVQEGESKWYGSAAEH